MSASHELPSTYAAPLDLDAMELVVEGISGGLGGSGSSAVGTERDSAAMMVVPSVRMLPILLFYPKICFTLPVSPAPSFQHVPNSPETWLPSAPKKPPPALAFWLTFQRPFRGRFGAMGGPSGNPYANNRHADVLNDEPTDEAAKLRLCDEVKNRAKGRGSWWVASKNMANMGKR